ncbi:MAG TPA: dihydroorotase, partial [Spirochaetota bacterium]
KLNLPVLAHEEDFSLVQGGVIHEGSVSSDLHLRGIPREAEEVMIARDILLARLTGGKLHIQHLSSAGSVSLIRQAKNEKISVSCETAPHYFSLTDEAIRTFGANAKMNPPLREEKDRRMVIEGLRDGTIDVIATDHAPHLEKDKQAGLDKAPFGIIGLETAVPLIITKLVREENFSYIDAFSKVTCNPASILGIDRGSIGIGKAADITLIDPDRTVKVTRETILSRCKNSPFIGMTLFGKATCTISRGKIAFRE